jgi:hypothetical protein
LIRSPPRDVDLTPRRIRIKTFKASKILGETDRTGKTWRLREVRKQRRRTAVLADLFDHVAGGDDSVAGAMMTMMINAEQDAERIVVVHLMRDVDGLRRSVRTRH